MEGFDVDAVFCISLKERDERREGVLEEAKKIAATVEFVLVERDHEDPQRGCFNSHKQCAEIALERGYKRILVLEDDVRFEGVTPKNIARINRFLNRNDVDIFYLGAILGRLWLTWSWGIARVRGKASHAIILNRAACEKIVKIDYSGKGIDSVFSKIFKSCSYICFPMIAYQQPEKVFKSDLDEHRGHAGKDVEYWDRMKSKQYTQAFKNLYKTVFRVDL